MRSTLLRTRLADLVRRTRDAHRRSSATWIRRMESPQVRRDLID